MNGYSIVLRKIEDKKETEENIPIFVDETDIEKTIKENPLIEFGIKHLTKRIEFLKNKSR